ncbi:MAG: accessory factor UbiK family protein [Halieaceae bacterium]|jgi:BMFP domain-containing protein YqiC
MARQEDEGSGKSERISSLKPPGLGELFDRLVRDESGVLEQVDRNAKALAKTALNKLDVVSRAEFDAQTAVLQRTRTKVEELERAVAELTEELEKSGDS